MEFCLYGRGGFVMVEGVENFKCMGRPLKQTDDDWPAVRRNIKRPWRVWERSVKMLRR